MREIRTYGSEGGGLQEMALPLPLSWSGALWWARRKRSRSSRFAFNESAHDEVMTMAAGGQCRTHPNPP